VKGPLLTKPPHTKTSRGGGGKFCKITEATTSTFAYRKYMQREREGRGGTGSKKPSSKVKVTMYEKEMQILWLSILIVVLL